MKIPPDLKFMKSHEWARANGNVVTMGISEYAVKHLSDLVFLDLPAVGKKVTQGQSLAEIESVKAVADIYAPVTGEVTEVNDELVEHLDRLGADPYGQGWMVKIKVGPDAGLEKMMTVAQYEEHLKTEPQ